MESHKVTNILLSIIGALLALGIFVFYQMYQKTDNARVRVSDRELREYNTPVNQIQYQQPVQPVLPKQQTNTNPVSQTSGSTSTGTTQVKLDTTSEESAAVAQMYKTALTNALAQPANFNGHYVLVGVGCGSGCISYIGVDKNTGVAFSGPVADWNMHPGLPNNEPDFSVTSDILKTVAYDKINTYQFNSGRATFVLLNSVAYPN